MNRYEFGEWLVDWYWQVFFDNKENKMQIDNSVYVGKERTDYAGLVATIDPPHQVLKYFVVRFYDEGEEVLTPIFCNLESEAREHAKKFVGY